MTTSDDFVIAANKFREQIKDIVSEEAYVIYDPERKDYAGRPSERWPWFFYAMHLRTAHLFPSKESAKAAMKETRWKILVTVKLQVTGATDTP